MMRACISLINQPAIAVRSVAPQFQRKLKVRYTRKDLPAENPAILNFPTGRTNSSLIEGTSLIFTPVVHNNHGDSTRLAQPAQQNPDCIQSRDWFAPPRYDCQIRSTANPIPLHTVTTSTSTCIFELEVPRCRVNTDHDHVAVG